MRQGIELRNNRHRSADAVQQSGRPHARRREREPTGDFAQSETPRMDGYSTRENRETPSVPGQTTGPGRLEKAMSRTSSAHGDGESDGRVLPTKGLNADDMSPAEASGEGDRPRRPRPGLSARPTRRACCWVCGTWHEGIRFTALLHHVTVEQLQVSFYALKRAAAPGADGVTWTAYARRTSVHE